MKLVKPSLEFLPSYKAALERGWSPGETRPATAQEELERIAQDADAFVALLDDPEAKGPPITLADNSKVNRIPGFKRWMWDGEFCGDIGLRWQYGTVALPEYCLGHIGYGVVPWKQRQGYAKQALAQILVEAKTVTSLPHVDITTSFDNEASQKVILANGGQFIAHFTKPASHGGTPGHLYRIKL